MTEIAADIVPGSRRTFAGVEFELTASPQGYVYKRDSGMLHVPGCPHEPANRLEHWSTESVEHAWHAAPDLPLNEVASPRFCTTCLVHTVRSAPQAGDFHNTEQIAEVAAAAAVVLTHVFGDGRSVIDPAVTIWSAEVAERLRAAIEDSPDGGPGNTWDKLQSQLEGQPRAVVLLAAELYYLRSVPLINVTPATKVDRLTTVLSRLPDSPALPEEIVAGASTGGCFNGGQGYNQQLWQQLVWLATFVARWDRLAQDDRERIRADPWAFRGFVVHAERDLPSMRNAFIFLVFPAVFENIVNDGHKYAIRSHYAYLIGGPSGDDSESVDRDLQALRAAIEERSGERISWYYAPWDEWQSPSSRASDRSWAVRARPGGRELVEQWVGDGFVSLAATHLGEVAAGAELAVVRNAVRTGYDHQDYAQQHELGNDYYAFLTRMEVGDAIVTRSDETVWIGRITSEPFYAPEGPRLRRAVTWEPSPRELHDLPAPLPSLLSQTGTVLDLTAGREVLEAQFMHHASPEPSPEVTPSAPGRLALRDATPGLAAKLHTPQPWLDDLITTLDSRQQVILYGPPGTGKTYTAREIARHVAGDAVRVVQFHPSYAYEDFFEGFRPTGQADGRLSFELRPGPLRQIAADAAAEPEVPWVLIIDEINRGNIAKIFGELYFLLEYRDAAISLQYSSERPFTLPPNLYLIGTMNTADRSIAMVDAAIRRRFAFVELHPDTEPVEGLLERWLTANLKSLERAHLLRALNAELGQENRDFQLGPSYLMRPEAEDSDGLGRIWRYDILPLLEEHFYGQLTTRDVASRFGLSTLQRRIATRIDTVVAPGDVELGGVAEHSNMSLPTPES